MPVKRTSISGRAATGSHAPSKRRAAPAAARVPSVAVTGRGGELDEAVDAVAQAMAALRDATEQLQQLVAERTEAAAAAPSAALERAGEIFIGELGALLGDAPPDDDVVRRAARQTVAVQAWERRLGTLIDSSDVVALLGVTRQQVSALAKQHRLIALKHDGRHRFPAWQFADTDARQRACLAAAHRRLVDGARLSPWTATSWFVAAHPELDDVDPVSFLQAGGGCDRVLAVADRDAARAAQ